MIMIGGNKIINLDYIKYIDYDEYHHTLRIFFEHTCLQFINFDENDYDDLIVELEEKELL